MDCYMHLEGWVTGMQALRADNRKRYEEGSCLQQARKHIKDLEERSQRVRSLGERHEGWRQETEKALAVGGRLRRCREVSPAALKCMVFTPCLVRAKWLVGSSNFCIVLRSQVSCKTEFLKSVRNRLHTLHQYLLAITLLISKTMLLKFLLPWYKQYASKKAPQNCKDSQNEQTKGATSDSDSQCGALVGFKYKVGSAQVLKVCACHEPLLKGLSTSALPPESQIAVKGTVQIQYIQITPLNFKLEERAVRNWKWKKKKKDKVKDQAAKNHLIKTQLSSEFGLHHSKALGSISDVPWMRSKCAAAQVEEAVGTHCAGCPGSSGRPIQDGYCVTGCGSSHGSM
ncbi:hypothetical protein Anapl_14067 [Anas platyrhynchos]|uniref:Uncharacterized protein n=1 Tax=Anas platyrhynchos TaxID=8839 RepID=R0JX91_ANAPL|nr:hypothetical protein Anapl_14067 [Anas platyrhynchos]